MSISPITGLGLCELRELCERLILSSVWAVLLHKAGDVFTLRPCASAGKQQVVLDFLRLAGMSFCAAIVRQAQRANRMISHRDAGLFAVGQYWFIDICGGNLLGRVDLRVDRGHLINHMTIQDAPRADDYLRRSRIGSGRHRGRPSPRARSHSSLPDLFILICQITLMTLKLLIER